MDWEYIRIWGLILVLTALGVALLWGLSYAVYLYRIGSRGWASTRRMVKSCLLVFSFTLPFALILKEGKPLWTLAKGCLGSAEGQFRTGNLYLVGNTFLRTNPMKAVDAFRQAANQGHAQAQFALAQAYCIGRGTSKDRAEGLRWARVASNSGNPMAMLLVGELLQASAPSEAETYFCQAAPLLRAQGELGDGEACFSLGFLYRNGSGVAKDPEEALAWMLLAQRLGISPLQGYALETYEKSLTPDQRAQGRFRAETLIQVYGMR